jgi:hypothetical protein
MNRKGCFTAVLVAIIAVGFAHPVQAKKSCHPAAARASDKTEGKAKDKATKILKDAAKGEGGNLENVSKSCGPSSEGFTCKVSGQVCVK